MSRGGEGSPAPDSDAGAGCACIDRAGSWVSGSIERFFQRLGALVGSRPWLPMLVSVLLVVLCALGYGRFEEESRGEKLWVPGGTQAQKDKDFVEAAYVNFARFEEITLTTNARGSNVLTKEAFDILLDVHEMVVNVTAPNPLAKGNESEPAILTYDNMCFRRGGECYQLNLLATFDFDPQNWADTPTILARLNNGNVTTNTGEPLEVRQVLGGVEEDANGDVTSAKAIAVQYFIQNNKIIRNNDEDDPKAESWEKVFLDTAESAAEPAKVAGFSLDRFATRSFEDEFGGSIEGDLPILNAAIVLLLIYTIVMLSRWSAGCVGSRVFLSIGGFISIGMAIAAALGLGSGFGLFYSPLMSVFPFLIIGIGVDDVFVLVNAFDLTPKNLPTRERISQALGVAGSSIVVTSMTDFFAFLIGSNTSLPALRNFSIYAALGVLFALIFQVTFFAGWLTLDAWRMKSNRMDMLMCVKLGDGGCCSCGNDSILANALHGIARLMSMNGVKAAVLIMFAGIAAGGIAGIANIEVDADVDDFIPTDSYLRDWNDVKEDYFNVVGDSTGVYMQNVEFSSGQVQDQLAAMCQAFKDDPYVVPTTVRCWYEDLVDSRAGAPPPQNDSFYEELADFLAAAGRNFARDVVLDREGRIQTCRFTGNHIFSDKSNKLVDFMDSLRATVKEVSAPLGPNSFAFGGNYVQIEQYKVIGREALINIGLALLMVLVIITALLVNPFAAVLTFASICLVVVELVGYMGWMDFSIDNVVVIFVVISLGLSVDYSAHIAHAFLVATGSPNERMVKALTEMGPAVLNGATSTFMAVAVLGLTNSYVFQVFFSALVLTVVLGVGHGMVLLPVALSIFAPKSHKAEEKAPGGTEMQQMGKPLGPTSV